MPIREAGRVSREMIERAEDGTHTHTIWGSRPLTDGARYVRSIEQIRELRRECYLAEDLCPDCRTALDDFGTCATCGVEYYPEEEDAE